MNNPDAPKGQPCEHPAFTERMEKLNCQHANLDPKDFETPCVCPDCGADVEVVWDEFMDEEGDIHITASYGETEFTR